jgi:hypothetical protein
LSAAVLKPKRAWPSAGSAGQVTVVGYDADPSAVSLLKSGAISALVIQQPVLPRRRGGGEADLPSVRTPAGTPLLFCH